MKRKFLATLIAVISFIACSFGFASCGSETPPPPTEPTALEKAYATYYKTQNMKVTVTDNRVQKYGNNFSATVELDYAHKAAHTKEVLFGGNYEHYYEINGENESRNLIIYSFIEIESVWNKIVRSDLFDGRELEYDSESEYEIHLLCNWVEYLLPPHALRDTCYRETETGEHNWVSLEFLSNLFTETANGYTASVYFCINDNGVYIPYAGTATVKLDGQGRFKSSALDFGTNGKITCEYSYGTANVIIPNEVKNASSN